MTVRPRPKDESQKPVPPQRDAGDAELPTQDQMVSGVLHELQRHFRVLQRALTRSTRGDDAGKDPPHEQ